MVPHSLKEFVQITLCKKQFSQASKSYHSHGFLVFIWYLCDQSSITTPQVAFNGVMLKSQPHEEPEANSTQSRPFKRFSKFPSKKKEIFEVSQII